MTEANDTLKECKDRYVQSLVGIGIERDEATSEAQIVLTTLMDLSVHQLFAAYDKEIGDKCAEFDRVISERSRRVPLQYVLGHTIFMGLVFDVAPGVLIPRPETEILVERAVAYIERNKHAAAKFFEVGPGSGCICVSILKNCPEATATAVEVSAEAAAICLANAKKHGVDKRLTIIEADFLSDEGAKLARQAICSGLDIFVSNPPYINPADMAGLAPEVKDHEPTLALAGKDSDGMGFYRKFAEIFGGSADSIEMAEGATAIIVEVGYDQCAAVSKLFTDCGLSQVEQIKDLSGIDRFVFAVRGASI